MPPRYSFHNLPVASLRVWGTPRPEVVESYRQMLRKGRRAPPIVAARYPYPKRYDHEPGGWYIVDGRHRVAAAALEGRTYITAIAEIVAPPVDPLYILT